MNKTAVPSKIERLAELDINENAMSYLKKLEEFKGGN